MKQLLRITALIWFSLSGTVTAQTLTLQTSEALLVQGAENLVQLGDSVYLRNRNTNIDYVTVGLIRVQTEAANIEVLASDIKREPVEVENIAPEYYRIMDAGKFWIDVTVIDFEKNLYGRQQRILIVGETPTPDPDPDPDPEPEPTPDAPIDAEGMHILVVVETADISRLSQGQRDILYSEESRNYLMAVANRNWRMLDKDTEYTDPNNKWAKALKRDRDSVPWIIISNGTTGYEGPLPESLEALKAIVTPLVPSSKRSSKSPLPKITKYSKDGCHWCDKWDAEVKPYLPLCDYKEVKDGSVASYPTFHITHNGQKLVLVGYKDIKQIQQAIRRLEEY